MRKLIFLCCSKAPGAGDPLLLQLFGSLPQLPAAPPQLQYTAALALAAYSDWFAKTLEAGASADAGSLMPKLLEMLTTGELYHASYICS